MKGVRLKDAALAASSEMREFLAELEAEEEDFRGSLHSDFFSAVPGRESDGPALGGGRRGSATARVRARQGLPPRSGPPSGSPSGSPSGLSSRSAEARGTTELPSREEAATGVRAIRALQRRRKKSGAHSQSPDRSVRKAAPGGRAIGPAPGRPRRRPLPEGGPERTAAPTRATQRGGADEEEDGDTVADTVGDTVGDDHCGGEPAARALLDAAESLRRRVDEHAGGLLERESRKCEALREPFQRVSARLREVRSEREGLMRRLRALQHAAGAIGEGAADGRGEDETPGEGPAPEGAPAAGDARAKPAGARGSGSRRRAADAVAQLERMAEHAAALAWERRSAAEGARGAPP